MKFDFPLAEGTYRVTSGFGPRLHPITLEPGKHHNGVDFAAPTGTAVYAVAPGKVLVVGRNEAINGNWVKVDHGGGWATAYLHLSRVDVTQGQDVKAGQVLGGVGSTGRSTGPHLHFILYKNGIPVDPMKYLGAAALGTLGLIGTGLAIAVAFGALWRYRDTIRQWLP